MIEGSEVDGGWDYPFGVHTHQIGSVASILGKPDEITFLLVSPRHPILVATDDVFIAVFPLRLT